MKSMRAVNRLSVRFSYDGVCFRYRHLYLLAQGRKKIRNKVEQVGVDGLRMTIITLAELKYGAYNSEKIQENLENISKFLRKVKILSLD